MKDWGFIKLPRTFLEFEWYSDANVVRVYIHLLLKANYTSKKWKGTEVLPGQVITGRTQLSQELKLSEQEVRTALNKLKATNYITTKSTNKFTIVSLVEWEYLQNSTSIINQQSNQETNQQSTNNQPTNNQQSTTPIEGKKEKKDKNEKKKENLKVFEPLLNSLIPYFNIDLSSKDRLKWLLAIDGLVRLDKYEERQIADVVKWARNHKFWSKNFVALPKLRRKDKDGVIWIERFLKEKGHNIAKSSTINIHSDFN